VTGATAQEVFLELTAGGSGKLLLAPPAASASFYVFSMEHSGIPQFWQLLARLMEAVGRPLCTLHGRLPSGVYWHQVARPAMRDLLCRDGYGFGIFYSPEPVFACVPEDRPKLLFLRDPRNMLQSLYWGLRRQADAESKPILFTEFLQSEITDKVIRRYRSYADYWHRHKAVSLFRFDDAVKSWSTIAADIVARLRLPIDASTVAEIAAQTDRVGDRRAGDVVVPGARPGSEPGPTEEAIKQLDARLAEVLAALGYPAMIKPPAGESDGHPRQDDQTVEPPDGARNLARTADLSAIFEPDPVMFSRLRGDSRAEMHVLGRRVVMDVDAAGCRRVIGQPPQGEKTLAVYGCSFTFGIAVNDDETFCSLLQGTLPLWRIENYGVPDFSQTHNLLQLERNARWSRPEFVTFCWIADHLRRNVGDATWIQELTGHTFCPAQERSAPRAALAADGSLAFRSVRVPRKDLAGFDLADFAHNQHYAALVCCRLLERANAVVTGYGGHFFVSTLWGTMPATLSAWLGERAIPVVDASLEGKQYICSSDDWHPNTLAHRIYAERIGGYLQHFAVRAPTAEQSVDA
jgi:hypothetical protein